MVAGETVAEPVVPASASQTKAIEQPAGNGEGVVVTATCFVFVGGTLSNSAMSTLMTMISFSPLQPPASVAMTVAIPGARPITWPFVLTDMSPFALQV